mgnify:FL=1
MSKENTNKTIMTKDEYIHSMHKFGRRIAILTIIIMIAMPTIAGIYFKSIPSISKVLATSVGLLAIFIPTNIGEVISYTPVLGSSIYLTFITGNLANLKLPVATNAMNTMDVAYGSEEADIFSSIAVGVSSFVTILTIAIGVLLMIPLKPILEMPVVKTATAYILPALFGNLVISLMSPKLGGGVSSPNRMLGAIGPVLIVAAVAALDKYIWHLGIMSRYQGIVVIALLILLYFSTKVLYKKGIIKVYLRGEEESK